MDFTCILRDINEVEVMKRRYFTIDEYINNDMIYTIILNNIRCCKDGVKKINDIIVEFSNEDEFFIGTYKMDGFNLTNKEIVSYHSYIEEYFNHIAPDSIKKPLHVEIDKELNVYRVFNNNNFHNILNKLFEYYLETVIFCPKISWNQFVCKYKDYMKNGTRDYIQQGYTDIIFSYIDSGDFCITFNSNVYAPQLIREKLQKKMFED